MACKEQVLSRRRSRRGKQCTLCFGEGHDDMSKDFKHLKELRDQLQLGNPTLLKILLKELERLAAESKTGAQQLVSTQQQFRGSNGQVNASESCLGQGDEFSVKSICI